MARVASVSAAVAAALLVSAAARPARAEPRFSARMGMPCAACHVNPTGGGMRNAFGRGVFEVQQLVTDLGARAARGHLVDPQVNDLLTFGMDFRLAHIWQPDRGEAAPDEPSAGLLIGIPTEMTFFPMQADLYTAADLGEHVTLYADIGALGSFELFGLLHDLPGGLYLKAGIFTPPYGTRLPSHTAAVRQPIGFDPRYKDAGVEVGLVRPFLDLQLAVQNGELSGSPIDRVDGLSLSGRASFILSTTRFKLVVGGSFQRIAAQQPAPAPGGARHTATEWRAGPFVWASFGRLTYLGEVAVRLFDDPVDAELPGQFVAYHELDFLIARGLELGATYEFMDRDVAVTDQPSDVVHRFGATLALFPVPYVELTVTYRRYLARSDRIEDGQNELLSFLHLFF